MQPYTPQTLPLVDLDYRLLLPLVGQANAALARYDGLLQGIPNPAVMLSPLTTQEAVLSSKIEGTQATVDEVLQQEAGLIQEGEKYKDIQEISNYRQALYSAREYLKDYPIRLGFVRELHRVLEIAAVDGFLGLKTEWQQRHAWQGDSVEILGESGLPLIGRCFGVDDDGALLLETATGIERIFSGDVSVRPAGSTLGVRRR